MSMQCRLLITFQVLLAPRMSTLHQHACTRILQTTLATCTAIGSTTLTDATSSDPPLMPLAADAFKLLLLAAAAAAAAAAALC
eukprot:7488-Heterococcus_DN1.PRE.2